MTSPLEHRIGPYTVVWRLGVTRAGTVYRAIDIYHTPVVLAVLDRATDGESRCRFADAVRRGWRGSGPDDGTAVPVLAADLTGPIPWVATRADGRPGAERMLAAITGEPPPSVSTAPPPPTRPSPSDPVPPWPPPPEGPLPPDWPPPAGGPAPQPDGPPGTPHGWPAPDGPPATPPEWPAADGPRPCDASSPADWPPLAGGPPPASPGIEVLDPAVRCPAPVPATASLLPPDPGAVPGQPVSRGSFSRVAVTVLTCLGILLVLAVPLTAMRLLSGTVSDPPTTPTLIARSSLAPSTATSQASESRRSASPEAGGDTVEPGLEPPDPGRWPADWPHFSSGDRTYRMDDLAGVGFDFRVPVNWGCLLMGEDDDTGYVRHACVDERHRGDGKAPGMRLIVRDCPDPCDQAAHEELRGDVQGWGRRWIAADERSTYVEVRGTLDGEEVYGLVVSRVFHDTGDPAPDRQVVLQSIVGLDDVPTIQKLANEIRAATG